MRKRESYERKYGKDEGGKLYHDLQVEAAAASRVARRLKRLRRP